MGIMDYFYQGSIKQVVYAEVNILAMLFLFWGANLRHSHVKLTYFHRLERFLMSPYQHQIHHSADAAHFDKNLGSKLAVWDNVFGTLLRSSEIRKLRFGLGWKETRYYNSFFTALFRPFVTIARSTKNIFVRKPE